MITDDTINNGLLNTRLIGGAIIGIDKFHADDYIRAGFITLEFVGAFLSEPYSEGETNSYTWLIRRVDGLINLRIWRK